MSIWEKRDKKDSKKMTEQEIRDRLYGSYTKPPEDEKTIHANLIKEKLEKEKRDLSIEKEEAFNKQKALEKNIVSLKAELGRARQDISGLSKKNIFLEKALSRTKEEQISSVQPPPAQSSYKPKCKIGIYLSYIKTIFNKTRVNLLSRINFKPLPKVLVPSLMVIFLLLAVIMVVSVVPRQPTYPIKKKTPLRQASKPLIPQSLYTVQICVYETEPEAIKLVDELKVKGYPAHFASKISTKGKKYFNIYLGKFPAKNQALAFLNKLKKKTEFEEFNDSFIRRM